MENTIKQEIKWEVGQKVWDTVFGEGEVIDFNEDYSAYPVKVRFKQSVVEDYTKEGKVFEDCERSLFFSEPVVTAELFPPKKTFVPTLKKGDRVFTCFDENILAYFEVFSEDADRIYVSDDGHYYRKNTITSCYFVGEEIKFS